MIARSIKEQRCQDVLEQLIKDGPCVFFTLTTPDVVDISEIRRRWRDLRHYLIEDVFGKGVKYVMNFEVHPKGHGWHIHSVFSKYVPLKRILPKIRSFGFGRVDVRRVGSKGVADYLTKHALKAYRGISSRDRESGLISRLRLVNTSRGLPRLSDYVWRSDFKSGVARLSRLVSNSDSMISRLPFIERYKFCELGFMLGARTSSQVNRISLDPTRSSWVHWWKVVKPTLSKIDTISGVQMLLQFHNECAILSDVNVGRCPVDV